MKLSSESFQSGARIGERYAFARKDPSTRVSLADNRNPQLSWTDVPAGTRSFVLICHDADAPTRPDNVNKEGLTVPASLARADFAHWVLVDVDPETRAIADGEFSSSVTPRGKAGPDGPNGTRQGLNNYTQWFESDKDMAGGYFGYDGPCPPWNDELVHHYYFTLYALDVPKCAVAGKFTRDDVLKAIRGHVLGQAAISATYSLNPKL
jgi:Raf kinase inhibitor-like YbhB/YbcL family protein